ncbi:hypothetical protein DICVIV_08707 [Dictyocaulus viviparus]|uniref:HEAT repeat-containing protein 1 n=1 Tax=Dictyocaulus viviparus TaxID=29172 RepID=A0A0D8XKV8_DICVI|nr:hypothetical protein DICVIV_08707 [Dictyocaulus viviparus]
MTLLSNQLLSLRTATARHQTVEKRHVSLLFGKKEAQELDKESAYKIGWTGLKKLAQLDNVFNNENDLFDESRLHFHRSMINKEENAVLNRKIERFLFQLSPYMQHFACQQVLEWLVYKYQIYAYNAEEMILTFIPFHETNFFARMLSIIEYNFATSKDWGFLESFCKKEYPVPFSAILRNTLSSTHSLITKIADHLSKGMELVGEEFIESKCYMLFNFYAKLLTAVLGESQKVSDDLLTKIIPLVAIGLKAALPTLQQVSLMVICQISISTSLTPEITESLAKIVLMKLRKSSIENSFSALAVLCQRQTLTSFSKRAVLKMLNRADELCAWTTIKNLCLKTDLSLLLKPLWKTLFSIVNEEVYAINHENCLYALQETSEPALLHSSQAAAFLNELIEYSQVQYLYANRKFCEHVRSLVARFSDQWLEICSDWNSRDKSILNHVTKNYQLEPFMVVVQSNSKKVRKRRRSNSFIHEDSFSNPPTKLSAEKKNAVKRAGNLALSSQFSCRKAFTNDPMKMAREWIKMEMWDNVALAFEEMASRRSYFAHKIEEEIEAFVVEVIHMAVKNNKCPVIPQAQYALAETNLQSDFIVNLLSRFEKDEPYSKMSRTNNVFEMLCKTFQDETIEQFNKRIIFVIKMLNNRSSPIVDAKIFHSLFGILKEYCVERDELTIQTVDLLIKMLKSPGKYQVSPTDINIDFVVEMMRTTHNHHILRQLLRLLTAVVQLSPANVMSHMMSIFTFMGSGLLRKDNELTLGIIEDTLEALFLAICKQNEKIPPSEMQRQLIDVARVFAASACDIPAHRRTCMANAIARAVQHTNAWIISGVILEHFCARWQRSLSDTNKRFSGQDAFEDLALELCTGFHPVHQLGVVTDIVDFIVRLGGDNCDTESREKHLDQAIFDRAKHSLPKLRHFRFVMIGLVVKILCSRKVYEKLGEIDDDSLYRLLLPTGKRLMASAVELDEFVSSGRGIAEQIGEHQTLRYWIALSNRAENVSEKVSITFLNA